MGGEKRASVSLLMMILTASEIPVTKPQTTGRLTGSTNFHEILDVPTTAVPTTEHVIGLRVRFISQRNLTEIDINQLVVQTLKENFARSGLSWNIHLHLRNIQKTSP